MLEQMDKPKKEKRCRQTKKYKRKELISKKERKTKKTTYVYRCKSYGLLSSDID